jgi:GTP-binding protein HflX
LKQLAKLYHQRLPGDRLTTPEFAQRLAAISSDINQPVCVYLNRRGQAIRVGVGTPRQTQIPPLELPRYGAERLSGIRCIATQLKPEPPNEAALTSMALQRLDALVTLNITSGGFEKRGGGVTGYVKEAYLSHLVPSTNLEPSLSTPDSRLPTPQTAWSISSPLSLDILTQQDFLDLVEGLEAEFERGFVGQQVDTDRDRVLLVGIVTDNAVVREFQDRLVELGRLVETAGGEVLQTVQQKRPHIHPQTVVGAGKVQEIALTAQTLGVNLIVFDRGSRLYQCW